MCGIAGLITDRLHDAQLRDRLDSMAEALSHRGPDEQGQWDDRHVGLVSRRLSIVDLAGNHQPAMNEDGSVVVVFNGELFEYQLLREQLYSRGHRFDFYRGLVGLDFHQRLAFGNGLPFRFKPFEMSSCLLRHTMRALNIVA